jgi:hypothetical protein
LQLHLETIVAEAVDFRRVQRATEQIADFPREFRMRIPAENTDFTHEG